MDYYNWEDENKRSISSQSNIFFARLNRIPRTYSSNIKIRNQINENGLDVVLKSDIFPDKKETAADFSKNISLLLDHYADKIKQNTINNIEANNCLFLMKFEKKKICQNYNFILKAFPHLDLNIVIFLLIYIYQIKYFFY